MSAINIEEMRASDSVVLQIKRAFDLQIILAGK